MKRYIEILAKFYQDKYEVQCAIVRPVPYYGRFDNFELGSCHVIPALIRKAVDRQNPFEVWGSGYESRDFLHVSDVARGCLLALDRGIGKGAINLGSGTSVRINELAAEILRLAGHRPETVFNASRPSTIRSRTMSVDKARQLLGFRQSVSMTDGLKDTIDWYRGYSGA